eukprot:TRINITY_DN33328_c0_g1_i1.p1 TRINITY_DN33328_c0_g1~~TRINITY_DN33328_c0_g1_i1.p1  ORF type:complete len:1359 (+),score=157.38 TRINITY_DN33328_c0_g1_i1:75-4079(+)
MATAQCFCIIHPESDVGVAKFGFSRTSVNIELPDAASSSGQEESLEQNGVAAQARQADSAARSFAFDQVFEPGTSQERIFHDIARFRVLQSLDSFNSHLFLALGGTGGGKTFAVTGGAKRFADRGLIPRSVSAIFEALAARADSAAFKVAVSFFEIYRDSVIDLLSGKRRRVIVEDTPSGPCLVGLLRQSVDSENDAYHLLFQGDSNRHFERLPSNPETSRGHVFYQIHISKESGEEATLSFVDLAAPVSTRNHATASVVRSLDALRAVARSMCTGMPPDFESCCLTKLLQPWIQPAAQRAVPGVALIHPMKYLKNQEKELYDFLQLTRILYQAMKSRKNRADLAEASREQGAGDLQRLWEGAGALPASHAAGPTSSSGLDRPIPPLALRVPVAGWNRMPAAPAASENLSPCSGSAGSPLRWSPESAIVAFEAGSAEVPLAPENPWQPEQRLPDHEQGTPLQPGTPSAASQEVSPASAEVELSPLHLASLPVVAEAPRADAARPTLLAAQGRRGLPGQTQEVTDEAGTLMETFSTPLDEPFQEPITKQDQLPALAAALAGVLGSSNVPTPARSLRPSGKWEGDVGDQVTTEWETQETAQPTPVQHSQPSYACTQHPVCQEQCDQMTSMPLKTAQQPASVDHVHSSLEQKQHPRACSQSPMESPECNEHDAALLPQLSQTACSSADSMAGPSARLERPSLASWTPCPRASTDSYIPYHAVRQRTPSDMPPAQAVPLSYAPAPLAATHLTSHAEIASHAAHPLTSMPQIQPTSTPLHLPVSAQVNQPASTAPHPLAAEHRTEAANAHTIQAPLAQQTRFATSPPLPTAVAQQTQPPTAVLPGVVQQAQASATPSYPPSVVQQIQPASTPPCPPAVMQQTHPSAGSQLPAAMRPSQPSSTHLHLSAGQHHISATPPRTQNLQHFSPQPTKHGTQSMHPCSPQPTRPSFTPQPACTPPHPQAPRHFSPQPAQPSYTPSHRPQRYHSPQTSQPGFTSPELSAAPQWPSYCSQSPQVAAASTALQPATTAQPQHFAQPQSRASLAAPQPARFRSSPTPQAASAPSQAGACMQPAAVIRAAAPLPLQLTQRQGSGQQSGRLSLAAPAESSGGVASAPSSARAAPESQSVAPSGPSLLSTWASPCRAAPGSLSAPLHNSTRRTMTPVCQLLGRPAQATQVSPLPQRARSSTSVSPAPARTQPSSPLPVRQSVSPEAKLGGTTRSNVCAPGTSPTLSKPWQFQAAAGATGDRSWSPMPCNQMTQLQQNTSLRRTVHGQLVRSAISPQAAEPAAYPGRPAQASPASRAGLCVPQARPGQPASQTNPGFWRFGAVPLAAGLERQL